jgi:hypothetical protein
MRSNGDTNQRLKELVARIETEQDAKKFTELVKELNRLLDGKQPVQKQPMSSV